MLGVAWCSHWRNQIKACKFALTDGLIKLIDAIPESCGSGGGDESDDSDACFEGGQVTFDEHNLRYTVMTVINWRCFNAEWQLELIAQQLMLIPVSATITVLVAAMHWCAW
eukprot:COSAG01_NODE_3272_length_6321_cov_12.850530_4_plen_111_part_00